MAYSIYLAKIAVLVIIGFIGYEISNKTNLFEIPIYLVFGIVFGHLLNFSFLSHPEVAESILYISMAFLLFYGGYELHIEFVKKNLKFILTLTTLGIVITAVIVGYATVYLIGWSILTGLLFGSLISAIDPATLIPLFDRYPVNEETETLLISESGYNDATAAVLTSVVLTAIITGSFSVGAIVTGFLYEAGIGTGVGIVIGILCALLLKKMTPHHPLFRLPVFTAMLGGFFIPYLIGGSGFMGAITAGLFLKVGESKLEDHFPIGKARKILTFSYRTSLLGRIIVFTLMGSLVSFSAIESIGLGGLGVIAVLMFVARPATVLICYLIGHIPNIRKSWNWKELGFISWTGDVRGAIPATLAGLVVIKGIPQSHSIAGLTFLAIIITILIQATTTPLLIKK